MARRAVEVGAAVGLWQAQGRPVVFLTLTMRHRRGQTLSELWEALSAAWGRVTGGKSWTRDQEAYALAGWLKAVEVTWGRNGWHVHVHALLFLDRPITPRGLATLHRSMFERWSGALVARGLSAPLMVGQDVRLISGPADALAEYFTKATDTPHAVGLEFTHSQGKRARDQHGTDTPWRFLDRVQDDGDGDALGLWHEYERGSKGRRQLTWSQGFRAVLGLLVEKTDEEIAAEEIGTRADDLVVITPDGWSDLCRTPVLLAVVLDVTQRAGLRGLRVQLDAWGIPYSVTQKAVA